jgi:hypothetical protein
MGKTYRRGDSMYDDDRQKRRHQSHTRHSNNKKLGGMKIINDPLDEDYFDDEVQFHDSIVINTVSDDTT